ncbi:MAG TPA: very short patch repair endonuclease [Candidatus Paceibacterota bacterium]|nr:very short patch repair endonuclease [Verrucomicrobiota bacterium]HRY50486.1 very short patch repair endonuclease [Candidatus Paceibacterota bacterium]
MADVLTKKKRSQVMAAVRSTGNRTTELKLVRILRAHKITGWRRHQLLPGKPDFVFQRRRLAIFVDGCFWHGCPRHLRMPHGNRSYWKRKIERNIRRDHETTRLLKEAGWRVLRIWEHTLRSPEKVAMQIAHILTCGRPGAIESGGQKRGTIDGVEMLDRRKRRRGH